MNKPEIIIVDKDDKIIGFKNREKLDYEKDIYRVSALWINDEDGNVLLSQRSFNKKHHPGLFGPAVAGTVERGESYFENITKETREELGLKNVEIKEIGKHLLESKYTHFTTWYKTIIDKNTDLGTQKSEVASVRWFSENELRGLFEKNPEMFLSSLLENFDEILKMSETIVD